MEHHGGELDHQNEGEKEHEHEAYRFQLQVFLGYQHLLVKDHVEITDSPSYSIHFYSNTLYNNIALVLGTESQIAICFNPYTGWSRDIYFNPSNDFSLFISFCWTICSIISTFA
jgi:hypothetical protein